MAMTKFQNYDRDQCWPLSGGRTHLLFILELLPPKKPRIQPILTRCVLIRTRVRKVATRPYLRGVPRPLRLLSKCGVPRVGAHSQKCNTHV
jgi:hypothetical protein